MVHFSVVHLLQKHHQYQQLVTTLARYSIIVHRYAHMKEVFTGGLRHMGMDFTDPQGAYFVLVNIEPYRRAGESDYDFCVRMVQEVGVAAVPGSSFFREDINCYMRLHFAKCDEVLYEALNRLERLKG